MVNVTYFNNEQKSTVFGYIAQLSESDTAYRNAVHICPTNAENWYNWGRYFEKRLSSSSMHGPKVVENMFISFLNAAIYTRKKDSFRMFLKCIKHFRHEKETSIGEYLRKCILSLDIQAFSNFCSFFIEDVVENDRYCSEVCLRRLSHLVPQVVLRLARIQIERLSSPALLGTKNEAAVEKLQHIISNSKFGSPREQLGLTMITSLCKKKVVFTLEETTYALLDSIFSTAASQIEGKVPSFDLKKTVERAADVMRTSSWNPSLLRDFLEDFTSGTMGLVELALKTYKWMDIIENILQTYISGGRINIGISSLVRGLGDFRILMFGYHEHCECPSKVYIDHFRPTSTFYISRQLLTRSLTIVGSDGREYVYAVMMAGTGHCGLENKVVTLANLINKLLRRKPEFFYTDFGFKKALGFTADVNLVEITEPVIVFGSLLENYLFKKATTPKKIFFEYLEAVENISGSKMYPGLERMSEILDPYGDASGRREKSTEGGAGTPHEEVDGAHGNPDASRGQADFPVIVNNNALPSRDLKLRAFRKMLQMFDKDILSRGLEDVYGDSHTYLMFKKKSILSYTLVSTFYYALFIHQHHPNRIGINLFSSSLIVSNIVPFTPDDNDYFRITQNIRDLYKEEGLEGVFVPFSHKLAVFLREEEFVKDFVEVFFRQSYAGVSERLGSIVNGGVKKVMNESSSPENLCTRDVLWHPWF